MKLTALALDKPLAKWSSVSMALGRSNQQSSCEKQGTIPYGTDVANIAHHTSQRNLWQLCWIVWRVGWTLAITPNQFHLKRCRWIFAVFGLGLVFQCMEFGPLMAAQFSPSLMTMSDFSVFFGINSAISPSRCHKRVQTAQVDRTNNLACRQLPRMKTKRGETTTCERKYRISRPHQVSMASDYGLPNIQPCNRPVGNSVATVESSGDGN